jgi:hypothetical protein
VTKKPLKVGDVITIYCDICSICKQPFDWDNEEEEIMMICDENDNVMQVYHAIHTTDN